MPKISIETDLDEFLKQLENWNGGKLPFQECVATALFHAVVLGYGDDFRNKFASELELFRSSVVRYALGHSAPRFAMQVEIVKFIRTDLAARKDQVRDEQRRVIAAVRSVQDLGQDQPPDKDQK